MHFTSVVRFFSVGLAVCSLQSAVATDRVIVSDIDDTLLISHVEKPIQTILNTFKKSKAFGAMPELLNAFGSRADVHYVSGSATFLTGKLSRFIEKNQFPSGPLYLMKTGDWFHHRTPAHKISTIQKLLTDYGPAQGTPGFILIGDNTEKDPETYEEIRRQMPDRIDAVYIHQVSPKNPPVGFGTLYISAVEIALYEYKAGRISVDGVEKTFNAFRTAAKADFKRLIPKWAYCPKSVTELSPLLSSSYSTDANGAFADERRRVAASILSHCSQRP